MLQTLHNTYSFHIACNSPDNNTGGTGYMRLYPREQKLVWSYEREDKLGLFRKKLTTKLTFSNNIEKNRYDFTILQNEEKVYACYDRDFVIQRSCDGINFMPFYKGKWHRVLCEWDYDKCEVIVTLRHSDDLSCLLDYDSTSNLIQYGANITASLGNVETTICSAFYYENVPDTYVNLEAWHPAISCDDAPSSEGWTVVNHFATSGVAQGDPGTLYVQTTYARVVKFLAPLPIAGWTPLTGMWVRSPETHDKEYYLEGPESNPTLIGYYKKVKEAAWYKAYTPGFDNGHELNTILREALDDICPNINLKSEFFGINAVGDAPDNIYYQKIEEMKTWGRFVCWHITDVVFPNADNATIARIKFIDFLSSLRVMFNLGFSYNDNTNTLNIEHLSYFNKECHIDLTLPNLVRYIRGGHKYSYDNNELKKHEKYAWGAECSIFFDMDIDYDICVAPTDNEVTYTAESLYTDLRYIADISEVDTETFVNADTPLIFIALVDSEDVVVFDASNPRPNSFCSYRGLELFHYYKRPHREGRIDDGSITIFDVQRPVKKQIPLSIPICCTDVVNFDPSTLVRSQMGLGEIDTATIEDPPRTLTINLYHYA